MSNALTIERTPGIIAIEINSIKDQTKKIMLCSSLEIGHRLVEAKELVPHGEWGDWLEKQVDYSQRTANNLMQLYKEYGGSQMNLFGGTVESQAIANLTYTQAVALLGIPSHEREQFVQENDVENLSTRDLQQIIKERDELQRQLKEVEDNTDQIAEERDKALEEADKAKGSLRAIETNIDVLKKQLADAKDSGATPERMKELERQLRASQKEVKELTEQASQPVTLEPAIVEKVVEKVPEEVEVEINELRARVKQFEEKAGQPEAMIKFKVRFDTLVGDFKDLLAILDEIKEVDPAAQEKYKGAVTGLIKRMQQSL